MEAFLIIQKAELLAIEAEIQGMVAENQLRISNGEAIAYSNSAFVESANDARRIANQIEDRRRGM